MIMFALGFVLTIAGLILKIMLQEKDFFSFIIYITVGYGVIIWIVSFYYRRLVSVSLFKEMVEFEIKSREGKREEKYEEI